MMRISLMILLLLECVVVISADLLQELRTALLFCWGVCKGHPQGMQGYFSMVEGITLGLWDLSKLSVELN